MTRTLVATRAQLHVWAVPLRGRLRLARRRAKAAASRHSATLLVIFGALGALGGGALIGIKFLGLVMIAESCSLIWLGVNQEDGQDVPIRGARTAQQVLDDERLRE
jgi:hypothetical protein